MRFQSCAQHLRALSKASALIFVGTSIAACSNGATRIDSFITNSTKGSPNQGQIIRSAQTAKQVYPGAASPVSSGPTVLSRAAPQAVSTVSRAPLPPVNAAPAASRSIPQLPATRLPQQTAGAGALVLAPRTSGPTSLNMRNTDPISTGSIRRADPRAEIAEHAPRVLTPTVPKAPAMAAAQPVSPKAGWDNSKGATVTVKPGETLYNLSRRYGVPVSEIMKANQIADANSVAAGRRILIPSYNYASTVPVSAPDSNPVTKASRASTGFQGQARGKLTVPTARVARTVPKTETVQKAKPVDAPKVAYKIPVLRGNSYTVQSGDTLYAIARRHGVTTNAIKDANGMTSDTVRLGQKLKVPSYGQRQQLAQNKQLDTTVTGSVPAAKVEKQTLGVPKPTTSIAARSSEKVQTAAKTSADAFRWPARGRLISKFGDRSAKGTNDGIDISVPVGTPIKASENGTVIYSGSELEDFGKLILLSHEGGWVTAYAHASATLVRRGDRVRRGQVIAKSGRTGNATVPKLHFEIRKNSNPVNPLRHLAN